MLNDLHGNGTARVKCIGNENGILTAGSFRKSIISSYKDVRCHRGGGNLHEPVLIVLRLVKSGVFVYII